MARRNKVIARSGAAATPRVPTPAAQEPERQAATCTNTSGPQWPGANSSIDAVEKQIEKEVAELAKRKRALQCYIENTLTTSSMLSCCRVEMVGSTSWGGDVPQSDLDLVLLTRSQRSEVSTAVELLTELHRCLDACFEDRPFQKLELLDAPRVPVLRLHDNAGLTCDVTVDQPHALRHRSMMRYTLQDRPNIRTLIRLVKFWMRRRGLPMAADGGISSLAWAITALRLAQDCPPNTPVDALLVYYFSKMQTLSDMALNLSQTPQGLKVETWRRSGKSAWAEDWIKFFWVDDPTEPQSADGAKPSGLTPRSIPVALAALYAAELRLAWKAVSEASWDSLWKLASPEVRLPLTPQMAAPSQCTHAHTSQKWYCVHWAAAGGASMSEWVLAISGGASQARYKLRTPCAAFPR